MANPTNSVTGIRTVAVPVSDPDRALAFYVDQLGCECRLDTVVAQLGSRWIEVAPPGSTTSVALLPASTEVPTGADTGIRFATGDAAALRDQLHSQGSEVGELLNWPGVPAMFTLRDPDGNRLVVVEEADPATGDGMTAG